MKKIIVITGMSGAGKSSVAKTLEDMGYTYIDNIPYVLIENLFKHIESDQAIEKAVVVIHPSHHPLKLLKVMNKVKELYDPYIVYLDTKDNILVRRYKDTKRVHPYCKDLSLLDAIIKERKELLPIQAISDYVIDTSEIKVDDLKKKIIKMFSKEKGEFTISFLSFGYKFGLPIDIDLSVDVRFLPNPFYVDELKEKTGMDEKVYNFVIEKSETKEFIKNFSIFLDYIVPKYKEQGRMNIIIGIGCTGGKHRSVALGEYFSKKYSDKYNTQITHRDCFKN